MELIFQVTSCVPSLTGKIKLPALGKEKAPPIHKLARDNFLEQELHKIASALECKFDGYFIFEDEEKI